MDHFINRIVVFKEIEGKIFYNGSRHISADKTKGAVGWAYSMCGITNYDVGTQTLYLKIDQGSVSELTY